MCILYYLIESQEGVAIDKDGTIYIAACAIGRILCIPEWNLQRAKKETLLAIVLTIDLHKQSLEPFSLFVQAFLGPFAGNLITLFGG